MNMSYTFDALIALMAMAVISLLVYENSRLTRTEKRTFYITYLVIAIAISSEWMGLFLNGQASWTIQLHKVFKALDYICTPLVGMMLIKQLADNGRIYKVAVWTININTIMQILAIFTGWTFYIDAENFYHHGSLHLLYVMVYVIIIILVLIGFGVYGYKYPKHNHASLVAIVLLMSTGIIFQEVGGYRTYCISMAFSALLLFIHYSEFSQLNSDFKMEYQNELLQKDILSGLYSRYEYNQDVEMYEKEKELPEDLVVFSMDINGLKVVNDSLGHIAGDELIRGASSCISEVLGSYGKCYRTGGDEFIAFLQTDKIQAEELNRKLLEKARNWHGLSVSSVSFSTGYCVRADQPKANIEQLIIIADNEMYKSKELYYREKDLKRVTR